MKRAKKYANLKKRKDYYRDPGNRYMVMPTTIEEINTSQRQIKALQLRSRGKSLPDIAEIISSEFNLPNYTRSHASRDIDSELTRVQFENISTIQKLRQLEIMRLEFYLDSLYTKIAKGDLFAISSALQISDKLAKIQGLYAPVEMKVNDLADERVMEQCNLLFERIEADETIPTAIKRRILQHATSLNSRFSMASEN